uniref:Glycine receptor subunit alpha-4-like n=1 Tax=Dermatophagoides pteronyssinus TaxID=6956 RepID=A0A6P6Y461_DERPT
MTFTIGQPTKVRFHVWVLGLDSIDEGSMTYVADIFMSQSWKDNRLIIPDDIVFNVNTSNDPRGPYRLLPLTFIDKIWRPDSFFKNAKEVTFQEMTIPNHYIWLYSDNTILYMVKLTLLLSCAMKFQTYPHDTQNCTMKIESFRCRSLTRLDNLEFNQIISDSNYNHNQNKINESMKCSMNEDDEEDVFLGDNPMNSCRRNRQQQQTNDRKQSFIYAFPTPSIYDDQNFCYRSWRVPPFQQTTATTG